MSKRFLFIASCLLSCFFIPSINAEDRTWTDKSGKFSVEALLLDYDGSEVTLKKKSDGKTVKFNLDKLSDFDRQYVKQTMADLMGETSKPTDASTKKSLPGDDTKSKATPQKPGGAFTGKPIVVKKTKKNLFDYSSLPSSWAVKPDPSPVVNFQGETPKLRMVAKDWFRGLSSGEMNLCFCDKNKNKVLATVELSNFREKGTQAFFGNMESGLVFSQRWPAVLVPKGISPNGTRAIFAQKTSSQFQFAGGRYLTVADTTTKDLTCIGVFMPFTEDLESKASEIQWADWIDDETIVAMSAENEVVAFDSQTGANVWRIEKVNETPVLSPGKKYILVSTKIDKSTESVILESKTGKPVGVVTPLADSKRHQARMIEQIGEERFDRLQKQSGGNIPRKYPHSLEGAFSPDGKRLAQYGFQALFCWDLVSGKLVVDSMDPMHCHTGPFRWVNDDFLLAGNQLMNPFDLVPVWQYEGLKDSFALHGGFAWRVMKSREKENEFFLQAMPIPHKPMPSLKDLPDEQKYSLRPGMEIRIQIEGGLPEPEKAKEEFEKKLRSLGYTVSDNAPVTCTASVERLPEVRQVYKKWTSNDPPETATFHPYRQKVIIAQGNDEIWAKIINGGLPYGSMHLPEGKTAQDQADAESKIRDNWYKNVDFPEKVFSKKLMGTSSITDAGIR